jgi:hypothetical protein
MSPEQAPSALEDHPAPVHSYLLAECGVLIVENLWLEDLVYMLHGEGIETGSSSRG